ncbi:MAG: hypothetical protein ACOY3Z_12820 [Thermodesulfobacteriota bacterium]
MKRLLLSVLLGGLAVCPGQAGATSGCASIDASLNVQLPCVGVGGASYAVQLNRYLDPAQPDGLYWQLGAVGLASDTSNCASVNEMYWLDIPCVQVGGSQFEVTLQRHLVQSDVAGLYWSLGQVQQVSTGSGCDALTFTASTPTLLQASAIFPGIVHDGTRLLVSYGSGNDLYIRPFSESFSPLAEATRLTNRGDVTDHKHIFWGNAHYLLYSTLGDEDLYLIKLDSNLAQQGATVTVAQDSITTRTNDMLLAVVDGVIVTGQFRPSDLNNNETTGHLIKRYDTSLNEITPDIVANDLAHINTASILQVGQGVTMVAPASTPAVGGTVRTQRDLLLIRYDTNWAALDSQAITLVDSTTITHLNDGDGLWMSTGLAYDATDNCLLVGHTFVDGASGTDSGSLHLRVFDGASYSETHSETMVAASANRAHFLLRGDTLYVVYDEAPSGSPAVYGLAYSIGR